jgi:hypothetical protein
MIQTGESETTHPSAFINRVTFLDILTSPSTEKNMGAKMERYKYLLTGFSRTTPPHNMLYADASRAARARIAETPCT